MLSAVSRAGQSSFLGHFCVIVSRDLVSPKNPNEPITKSMIFQMICAVIFCLDIYGKKVNLLGCFSFTGVEYVDFFHFIARVEILQFRVDLILGSKTNLFVFTPFPTQHLLFSSKMGMFGYSLLQRTPSTRAIS